MGIWSLLTTFLACLPSCFCCGPWTFKNKIYLEMDFLFSVWDLGILKKVLSSIHWFANECLASCLPLSLTWGLLTSVGQFSFFL
jgi:hypothetical protein